MKVLVTAFKPFNKSPNNYSIEVLKYIENVAVSANGVTKRISSKDIENFNLEEI